mmetsp:Transcript_10407/g.63535  ORF Transcript_10407/g.63535 Transcript_10407/m.63535 type:complete len:301 (+) Transcript_10407:9732-10634(+)
MRETSCKERPQPHEGGGSPPQPNRNSRQRAPSNMHPRSRRRASQSPQNDRKGQGKREKRPQGPSTSKSSTPNQRRPTERNSPQNECRENCTRQPNPNHEAKRAWSADPPWKTHAHPSRESPEGPQGPRHPMPRGPTPRPKATSHRNGEETCPPSQTPWAWSPPPQTSNPRAWGQGSRAKPRCACPNNPKKAQTRTPPPSGNRRPRNGRMRSPHREDQGRPDTCPKRSARRGSSNPPPSRERAKNPQGGKPKGRDEGCPKNHEGRGTNGTRPGNCGPSWAEDQPQTKNQIAPGCRTDLSQR